MTPTHAISADEARRLLAEDRARCRAKHADPTDCRDHPDFRAGHATPQTAEAAAKFERLWREGREEHP